jgi:hypothetical protein
MQDDTAGVAKAVQAFSAPEIESHGHRLPDLEPTNEQLCRQPLPIVFSETLKRRMGFARANWRSSCLLENFVLTQGKKRLFDIKADSMVDIFVHRSSMSFRRRQPPDHAAVTRAHAYLEMPRVAPSQFDWQTASRKKAKVLQPLRLKIQRWRRVRLPAGTVRSSVSFS